MSFAVIVCTVIDMAHEALEISRFSGVDMKEGCDGKNKGKARVSERAGKGVSVTMKITVADQAGHRFFAIILLSLCRFVQNRPGNVLLGIPVDQRSVVEATYSQLFK
ncbi:hypothetical protein H2248_004861 [Termitomyces sp. 'cryptogamus']|nr:hypothetical protein H2248_004861 [Termitomyces sp. 'cryptogamus']